MEDMNTHTHAHTHPTSSRLLPRRQCLMVILHLRDSAMVGQGMVSLGGFLTMCRVRVSRPHLKPQVLFLLAQLPHSLHWPTWQPSGGGKHKKNPLGTLFSIPFWIRSTVDMTWCFSTFCGDGVSDVPSVTGVSGVVGSWCVGGGRVMVFRGW